MRKCPPPLPVVLIALVVLAAFAGPAAAEDPPEPPDVVADPVPTPPGTPADVALWKAAGDVSQQVASVRWVGNGLHWKLRTDDLLGRLDAAAKGDPSAAPRLGEVRKKLVDAQVESYEILVSKWPVDPTRVCLYPQSMLGSAMQASATRDNRAQLEEARVSTSKCVDLARAAVGRTQRANDRLAQAIDAAENALGDPACQGSLSGKVSGTFACDVSLVEPGDGEATFVVQPRGPIPDVPAYAPGAFRLPLPVAAGTFTLDDLGMGKASVAAEGGALYTATKTTGQRGEVTLVLRTVKRDPKSPGSWVVHGTYRARLLPAGAGKEGGVLVEVTF